MNGQTRTPDIWQVLAGEITLEDLNQWRQRQEELEAMQTQQTPPGMGLVQLQNFLSQLPQDERRSYRGTPGAGLTRILGGMGAGGTGGTGGGLGVIAGLCWVAAAIYGRSSPEFICAWLWLNYGWQGRIAEVVRRLYRSVGPRLASHVTRHAWLRSALRPLFDMAVRRGAAFLARRAPWL